MKLTQTFVMPDGAEVTIPVIVDRGSALGFRPVGELELPLAVWAEIKRQWWVAGQKRRRKAHEAEKAMKARQARALSMR